MSSRSSIEDKSCFLDDNDNAALSLGLPLRLDARSGHPSSTNVHASIETVRPVLKTPHRIVNARPSGSPAGSFGSMSSGGRRMGNEDNLSSRSTSCTALHVINGEAIPVVEPQPIGDLHYPIYSKNFLRPHGSLSKPASLVYRGSSEDTNLDLDDNQTPPRPAAMSINPSESSLEDQAHREYPQAQGKGQAPNSTSEEEALAGIRRVSSGSPSRKNSPHVVVIGNMPQTFKTLISNVLPRHFSGPQHLKPSEEREDLGREFDPPLMSATNLEVTPKREEFGHRKTSSGVSSHFLGAVQSAKTGLSSSIATVGSRKTHWSRLSRFSKRDSTASDAINRSSVDSDRGPSIVTSKAARDRALQRRKVIGELINSEREYTNDLKTLRHGYFALLGSYQHFEKDKLVRVEDNITAMIFLHEDILIGMKSITEDALARPKGIWTLPRLARHIRYESIDSAKPTSRGRKNLKTGDSINQTKGTSTIAQPKEAADIASLFLKMLGGDTSTQMGRFSAYEEYGARFAEMLQTFASVSKNIPNWDIYERSIEALANSWSQTGVFSKEDKKARTFEDLMIKPMQRICKYPLLFAELESHCPTIDDPESHVKIANVLDRLRETVHGIDSGTNDFETQTRLQRSQHLQSLLKFPDIYRPSFSLKDNLGHAKLCGVLFVAYQTPNCGIRGDFMLCALFNSFMLLATPESGYRNFTINAIIGLRDVCLRAPGDKPGIYCYDTRHAWKIIFGSNRQLYELLFCACTELEEKRWKSELCQNFVRLSQQQTRMNSASALKAEFLMLEIKRLANTSDLDGSSSRGRFLPLFSRMTTQIPTIPVVIKNTYIAARIDSTEPKVAASPSSTRSNLLFTTGTVQILAPERIDRIRMEQALSDVWTRATLPYPGMTASRSGQILRASTLMMRRLSKASVASSTSKSSASQRSRASAIELGLDGVMEDPFFDHSVAARPKAVEQAGIVTSLPTSQYRYRLETKNSRKILFSNDMKRPKLDEAEETGSETSTIIENPPPVVESPGRKSTSDRSEKLKTLSKALSTEKIRGWLARG